MDQGTGMDNGVIRIRNLGASFFDIKVQSTAKAVGGTVMARDVHCLIVEEGAWTLPDGRKIEETFVSTQTSSRNSWTAESVAYLMSYSKPVVLGQVISTNDEKWSVFWAQGTGDKSTLPSRAGLKVGKHIGEDTATGTRANEMLGFIVMEGGHATMGGDEWEANRSLTMASGYVQAIREYSFLQAFRATPAVLVVSQVGQRGSDGSWAVTKGAPAAGHFQPAVDEDTMGDSERMHSSENLDYVALSIKGPIPLKHA